MRAPSRARTQRVARLPRELQAEALRWLCRHDPEYDWRGHDRRYRRSRRVLRDYVGAVRDNIRSFGREHTGRMSRGLRREVFA